MDTSQIDNLNHDQIVDWLKEALSDKKELPRLTPDESSYLAILRLDKMLRPATRTSIRDGTLTLLRRYSENLEDNVPYVEQLVRLLSAFKIPEGTVILKNIALKIPQAPRLSQKLQFVILGALVEVSDAMPSGFWETVFSWNPERYAGMALAGLLASDAFNGIDLLPLMPDTERIAEATVINLDLAWHNLLPAQRSTFVGAVYQELAKHQYYLSRKVKAWASNKEHFLINMPNPSLRGAILEVLGSEAKARFYTTQLCGV